MVQTALGANSNPWIVYMKECKLRYNAMKLDAEEARSKGSLPEEIRPATVKTKRTKRGEEGQGDEEGSRVANKKRPRTTAGGGGANGGGRTLEAFLPDQGLL